MTLEIKTLKPSHRYIMRILATNMVELKDVCAEYGLDYSYWSKLTNTTMFKNELKRIMDEMDEEAVKKSAEDPVIAKLKKLRDKVADRLEYELDNDAEDASPASRLRASENVLKVLGYFKDSEISPSQNVIHVSIGAEKLRRLQDTAIKEGLVPIEVEV